jgi:hypothetical protein
MPKPRQKEAALGRAARRAARRDAMGIFACNYSAEATICQIRRPDPEMRWDDLEGYHVARRRYLLAQAAEYAGR